MASLAKILLEFAIRLYTRVSGEPDVQWQPLTGKIKTPIEKFTVDNGRRHVHITLTYGPVLFGDYEEKQE